MTKSKSLVTEFNITGKLVDTIVKKDNQVKYLKLLAESPEERAYWIKVAKDIREDIASIAYVGADVTVKGTKKQKIKTGKIKYKTDYVELITSNNNCISPVIVPDASPLSSEENQVKAKAKVLICKKSNCWKKGGQEIYQALESSCGEHPIQVKMVGCLKQCKKAPNIVIMPDKARYSKVKPKQIPDLVEKHLFTRS